MLRSVSFKPAKILGSVYFSYEEAPKKFAALYVKRKKILATSNAHKIKKDFYENKAQGWPQSQKLKDRQYEYL